MTGPNYDLTSAWRKNIAEVRNDPESRREFVQQWADRTGTSFEIAWYWLCTDDLAAAQFAKDPRRQNSHEKIAADWITKIPGISGFKKLPGSGPSALYVKNGLLYTKSELPNDDYPKSIDFAWSLYLPGSSCHLDFFAAHKYTFEDGGSQENQCKDLMWFTEQAAALARMPIGKNYRLLSLADGPFYQKTREGGKSYMESLKAIVENKPFSRAMTLADLPAYMLECLEWLESIRPPSAKFSIEEMSELKEKIGLYA